MNAKPEIYLGSSGLSATVFPLAIVPIGTRMGELKMKTDNAVSEIRQVMKDDTGNFLKIGELLRKAHDELLAETGADGTIDFEALLKKVGIKPRRAAYWMEIDRVYGGLKLSPKRLRKIGWTKLCLIAVYVTTQSIDEMLNHAEEKTVPQLRAFLDHAELPTRVLAFNLTDGQYATVASALLSNGAYLTGTAGLGNKEAALVRVCKRVSDAAKSGPH